MENFKGKVLTTFVTILMLAFLLALCSIRPTQGALQITVTPTQDQQSTTGPVPVGGPHGAVAIAGEGFAPGINSKVIPNVPAYTWRDGCGPTSTTMILGYWDWYWDTRGKDWIIPGKAAQQTFIVDQIIASSAHETDYAIPHDVFPDLKLDKSEPPFGDEHISNSVADFMSTSFSSRDNYFGWSWFSDIPKAFIGYLTKVNPGGFTVTSENIRITDGTLSWEIYKSSIDQNHPIMLLVDSNGDGETDHFIPGIGYDDTDPNVKFYAAYNTWDGLVHWYRWRQMTNGAMYGVYGGTTLNIVGETPTATPTRTPTVTRTLIPTSTFTKTLVPSVTITPKPTIIITVTPTVVPTLGTWIETEWSIIMSGAIEMTDFSNLLVGGIPLIVVIFGLVEIVKSFGVTGKWLTVASLLLGLIFGMCYQLATKGVPTGFPDWFAAIVFSLALGLTTSGIYKFVAARTPETPTNIEPPK